MCNYNVHSTLKHDPVVLLHFIQLMICIYCLPFWCKKNLSSNWFMLKWAWLVIISHHEDLIVMKINERSAECSMHGRHMMHTIAVTTFFLIIWQNHHVPTMVKSKHQYVITLCLLLCKLRFWAVCQGFWYSITIISTI